MVANLPLDLGVARGDRSLPPGWRWVRFGDVVRNVKVDVDPATSGLERYVAGEHMDTDDLRIRRWGTIGDGYLGPAFHRKFERGQVLYGSRRTYLRKVTVADFDGVCANTTFVLEPNGDALSPQLLPFVMQTESFHAHSIRESKGSVNPYINWRDIAWYEFALPPKEEQRRIAEMLLAVEAALDGWDNALGRATKLKRALLATTSHNGLEQDVSSQPPGNKEPTLWSSRPLGDLLELCQYGLSMPMASSGRYPIFRMMNLDDGLVVENDMKYVDLTDHDFRTYRLQRGDILFNRTNSLDLVGKVGIYQLSGHHVFASYLIRLRVRRECAIPEYVNYRHSDKSSWA